MDDLPPLDDFVARCGRGTAWYREDIEREMLAYARLAIEHEQKRRQEREQYDEAHYAAKDKEIERLRAELRHAHEPLMRLQSQVDRSPHYKSITAAMLEIERLRDVEKTAERLRAVAAMLSAVVQGAQEEFVRVPYGASHEDVAQINDWHKMAREAQEAFAALDAAKGEG
jgi:hypothetical protein